MKYNGRKHAVMFTAILRIRSKNDHTLAEISAENITIWSVY